MEPWEWDKENEDEEEEGVPISSGFDMGERV